MTNKILLVALLAALFFGYLTTATLLGAVLIAATLLLGWALAREILPDQPWAAFFSMFLTYTLLSFNALPGLGNVFAALLLLRGINQTVAKKLTILDRILLPGAVAWLGWQVFQAPVTPPLPALLSTLAIGGYFLFMQHNKSFEKLRCDRSRECLSSKRVKLAQSTFVLLTLASFAGASTQITGIFFFSVLLGVTMSEALRIWFGPLFEWSRNL